MRHTCADGRVGKTRKFIAIEPTYPRRRILQRRGERVNRGGIAAHRGLHRIRAGVFPLALRGARIGHGHEHAAMGLGAQPHHATGLWIWHHTVHVLIGGILQNGEQCRACNRRIHHRAGADHHLHLAQRHGQIRAIPVGRRHGLRIEHGDVAHPAAGGCRGERFEPIIAQHRHQVFDLAHGGQFNHGSLTGTQRSGHHPCHVSLPLLCTGQRIKHKRLETLTGKRVMKHIDIGVIGGQTTIPLRSSLRNGTGNGKGRASRFGPIGIGATPGKTTLRIIRQ